MSEKKFCSVWDNITETSVKCPIEYSDPLAWLQFTTYAFSIEQRVELGKAAKKIAAEALFSVHTEKYQRQHINMVEILEEAKKPTKKPTRRKKVFKRR